MKHFLETGFFAYQDTSKVTVTGGHYKKHTYLRVFILDSTMYAFNDMHLFPLFAVNTFCRKYC